MSYQRNIITTPLRNYQQHNNSFPIQKTHRSSPAITSNSECKKEEAAYAQGYINGFVRAGEIEYENLEKEAKEEHNKNSSVKKYGFVLLGSVILYYVYLLSKGS